MIRYNGNPSIPVQLMGVGANMRVPVASVQNIPVQTAPVQQSSLQTMQQPMPQSVPQPPNPQDIQQNQGNNYIHDVIVLQICFQLLWSLHFSLLRHRGRSSQPNNHFYREL